MYVSGSASMDGGVQGPDLRDDGGLQGRQRGGVRVQAPLPGRVPLSTLHTHYRYLIALSTLDTHYRYLVALPGRVPLSTLHTQYRYLAAGRVPLNTLHTH